MPQETSKEPETTEVPWHATFPSPKTVAGAVSRDDVLQWLQEGKSDFVLVDLRRTDCEVSTIVFSGLPFLFLLLKITLQKSLLTWTVKGGMIRGSINLPAQSLYHTIPALYKLFRAANVAKVIWFCGEFKTPLPTSHQCLSAAVGGDQEEGGLQLSKTSRIFPRKRYTSCRLVCRLSEREG